MHVTELNDDELYQLKDALYWNVDGEYITDEQRAVVDAAEYPDDIPDSLVFDVYGHYDFVEEDFWCNLKEQ